MFQIRYNDRVEFVKNELKKKGFIAESFYNNPNNMSFNNILAVRNSSKVTIITKMIFF